MEYSKNLSTPHPLNFNNPVHLIPLKWLIPLLHSIVNIMVAFNKKLNDGQLRHINTDVYT